MGEKEDMADPASDGAMAYARFREVRYIEFLDLDTKPGYFEFHIKASLDQTPTVMLGDTNSLWWTIRYLKWPLPTLNTHSSSFSFVF